MSCSEDTYFTVLNITGRLHTLCPPIYDSHKNIYRILKLQGDYTLKIGFAAYSIIFTVFMPNNDFYRLFSPNLLLITIESVNGEFVD